MRVFILIFFSNLIFKNSKSSRSFSTAITNFAFSKSFSVKAPFPGPISRITSSFFISPVSTIFRSANSDFKKFCPKAFLARAKLFLIFSPKDFFAFINVLEVFKYKLFLFYLAHLLSPTSLLEYQ